MNVNEALALADDWTKGHTFYEGQGGWRVVIAVLANEVRELQSLLDALVSPIPADMEQLRRINELVKKVCIKDDE